MRLTKFQHYYSSMNTFKLVFSAKAWCKVFRNAENLEFIISKPGTHGQRSRAPGFLKLLWFACRYACVSMCLPPRALITSGMIWCDVGFVDWLNKFHNFPAFNYFI